MNALSHYLDTLANNNSSYLIIDPSDTKLMDCNTIIKKVCSNTVLNHYLLNLSVSLSLRDTLSHLLMLVMECLFMKPRTPLTQ